MFKANIDTFNTAIGLDDDLTNFSGIINTLVPVILILAGLVMFLMLISGGFTMLTSASTPDQAEKGKLQITTAITGFIIIFAAYWIIQILEIFLGLNIL